MRINPRLFLRPQPDEFAQAGNLHIQAAVKGFELAAARPLGARFARPRLARMAHQRLEHGKFTRRQRNFSAVLGKVGKAQMKRAVIVKNNKFEAVLLNMGEYERLCEAVEVLQSIYEAKKRAGSGE